MNTGKLQRRFYTQEPAIYDKNSRIVSIDIRPDTQVGEDGNTIEGYSCVQVQISTLIDYGHIKSQLIEAAFAPKEEFAVLMNSVDDIIVAVRESSSWAAFKSALGTDDIQKFVDFCEYRAACAAAAKEVLKAY